MLYVLAAFGLVLGGFGALSSASGGAALLRSRDHYVDARRKLAEQAAGELPEQLGTREDLVKVVAREADAQHRWRGVALPLAAMNLILSMLLFTGAMRAMRGDPWGWSAWLLAARASIAWVLLDVIFQVVQARDLQATLRETGGPLGMLSVARVSLQKMLVMLKATLELLYLVVCVLYLRRPSVRAYFLPPRNT